MLFYAQGHPLLSYGPVCAAMGIIFLLGLADDLFSLSSMWRALVQCLVAVFLVSLGVQIKQLGFPGLSLELHPVVAYPVSVVFLVWLMNLFNFMDGLDGLAGGMALFGFLILVLIIVMHATTPYNLLPVGALMGSVAGFLFWNAPPAKLFMGDSGSLVLGLVVGVSIISLNNLDLVPLWISLLIFSPFIVDTTATLFRRLWAGENIFAAHSTHYYQCLAKSPFGHKMTLLAEYALMAACGSLALVAVKAPIVLQWLLLGVILFVYCRILRIVRKKCIETVQ